MVALQEDVPVVPVARLRDAVLAARELRALLGRVRRADRLRRAAEGRPRLQGGDCRDRAPHQRALRLARRRPPRGGAPGTSRRRCDDRRRRPGRRCRRPPRHRRDRRLPERRQVDARQPPHRARAPPSSTRRRARRATARSSSASGTASSSCSSTPAASTSPHATPLTRSIADQARAAVAEADLVLFVVDARAGVTPGDEELAQILRERAQAGAPAREQDRRPGAGGRSRSSSTGSGSATRSRSRRSTATAPATCSTRSSSGCRARDGAAPGEEAIRVAILGRPNVGKSSLFNALIGAERTIVSDVPGTTRDAIDTILEHDGRTFVLVDTAGLRRKRRQRQGIEYYSELRALDAAEPRGRRARPDRREPGHRRARSRGRGRRAQGAVLDARRAVEVGHLDGHDRGRPAAAPAAAAPAAAVHHDLGADAAAASRACSTRSAELYVKHTGRIATAELNRFLGELREARQPPSKGGKRLNLLYGTQVADAAAALPLHRQRPEPRHARLRLLGREPAAGALRARRRPRVDRLPAAVVRAVVVGGGSWGTAFAATAARARPRRHLATPRPEDARGDPRDGAQPALPRRRSRSQASRRPRWRTRRSTPRT